MTFPRTVLLNDEEDCAWLLITHLKHNNPPPFAAFQLHGNEDCPLQLDLYKSQKPDYNEKPVMVYKLGEGKAYEPDRAEPVPGYESKGAKLLQAVMHDVRQRNPDAVVVVEKPVEPVRIDGTAQSAAHWLAAATDPKPYSVSIPLDTPTKPLTLAERLKLKGLK